MNCAKWKWESGENDSEWLVDLPVGGAAELGIGVRSVILVIAMVRFTYYLAVNNKNKILNNKF